MGHPAKEVSPLMCDLDGVGFVVGVCAVTAPWPVFGVLCQAGFDWVAVHVAEFFDALSLGEDVEVVVARLPDMVFCSGAGEALFEDLNCQGQWGCFWFGDE